MALGDDNQTTKSKASTYKKINKEEFEECLAQTELDFKPVYYDWSGEIIYEAYSKHETYTIRVYSSLGKRSGRARDKGYDAIRVVLIHTDSGRPLMKQRRVNRIQTYCKNLRKRIRNIVGDKDDLTYCHKCGSVMVLRERKSDGNRFYGCVQYPDCKGTKSFNG